MKVFLATFIIFFSSYSLAGCNSEDLVGYWDYYEGDSAFAINCSVRINAAGSISLHRFGCVAAGDAIAPDTVSGTATIDSYCHVTLSINANVLLVDSMQSTLHQNRAVISGIQQNSAGFYGQFKLVKFY